MPKTKRPSFPAKLAQPPIPRKIQWNPQAVATTSSGISNAAAMQQNMVRQLQKNGITDSAVLRAMQQIARHRFVDPALFSHAYSDNSLPIGLKQTISKPSIVARMLQLLKNKPRGQLNHVLEIGSGCGYQAAVLAKISRQVYSIERLYELHLKAQANLKAEQINNVELLFADGMLGHPNAAPFDGIIAAAGGAQIPQTWLDQLAIGGRLIAPVLVDQQQTLVIIDKIADTEFKRQYLEPVLFVPLQAGIIR